MPALFDASVRFLYRTPDNRMPPVCVLKMRSESIQLAQIIQAACPQAQNLFLHRDVVGWVGSFFRIFTRLGVPEPVPVDAVRVDFDRELALDADKLLPYLGRTASELSTVEYLTLWWLGVMEHYLAAVERGLPVTAALRFTDITQKPQAVLVRVIDLCGLGEASPRSLQPAFETDSQAGTPLSQARSGEGNLKLNAEKIRLTQAIVGRHPVIGDPRFTVPRTLEVA